MLRGGVLARPVTVTTGVHGASPQLASAGRAVSDSVTCARKGGGQGAAPLGPSGAPPLTETEPAVLSRVAEATAASGSQRGDAGALCGLSGVAGWWAGSVSQAEEQHQRERLTVQVAAPS